MLMQLLCFVVEGGYIQAWSIVSFANFWLSIFIMAATSGQTSILVAQMLFDQSAEGYKYVILRGVTISFNFCLMTTLTLILTLRPSPRRVSILTLTYPDDAFESFCACPGPWGSGPCPYPGPCGLVLVLVFSPYKDLFPFFHYSDLFA